ncbi:hypothetical protein B0H19DRAFT_1252386 [Mycena capillaripes]|nr:hypothetical protein B0H19DRAFT_1252386 [Mycena capillaripes]
MLAVYLCTEPDLASSVAPSRRLAPPRCGTARWTPHQRTPLTHFAPLAARAAFDAGASARRRRLRRAPTPSLSSTHPTPPATAHARRAQPAMRTPSAECSPPATLAPLPICIVRPSPAPAAVVRDRLLCVLRPRVRRSRWLRHVRINALRGSPMWQPSICGHQVSPRAAPAPSASAHPPLRRLAAHDRCDHIAKHHPQVQHTHRPLTIPCAASLTYPSSSTRFTAFAPNRLSAPCATLTSPTPARPLPAPIPTVLGAKIRLLAKCREQKQTASGPPPTMSSTERHFVREQFDA